MQIVNAQRMVDRHSDNMRIGVIQHTRFHARQLRASSAAVSRVFSSTIVAPSLHDGVYGSDGVGRVRATGHAVAAPTPARNCAATSLARIQVRVGQCIALTRQCNRMGPDNRLCREPMCMVCCDVMSTKGEDLKGLASGLTFLRSAGKFFEIGLASFQIRLLAFAAFFAHVIQHGGVARQHLQAGLRRPGRR